MSDLHRVLTRQEQELKFVEEAIHDRLRRTRLSKAQTALVNRDVGNFARAENVYSGPSGECSVLTNRMTDLVLHETAGNDIVQAEDGVDDPREAARNETTIRRLRELERRLQLDTCTE